MKNIYSLLLIALILTSCGGEKSTGSVNAVIEQGNLSKMKVKRDEVMKSYDSIGKF